MAEVRHYLVCDRCGFFYGDVTLPLEPPAIDCPECGHDAAWAFPTFTKAMDFQQQVREVSVAE